MGPPFRVASIAYICYTFSGQLSSPKSQSSSQPARRPLMLWNDWWNLVCELRPACARSRTFLWMSLCLAGFSTRKDLLGVTSIVRALGLEPACYDRLLDFFHSPALDLDKLTRAWCALVFRFDPGLLRMNGKPVLVGDGIKVAKAGRKMPGVKTLHQESDSNTKPEYIFGHSCQAIAVLTQALSSVFALPRRSRCLGRARAPAAYWASGRTRVTAATRAGHAGWPGYWTGCPTPIASRKTRNTARSSSALHRGSRTICPRTSSPGTTSMTRRCSGAIAIRAHRRSAHTACCECRNWSSIGRWRPAIVISARAW